MPRPMMPRPSPRGARAAPRSAGAGRTRPSLAEASFEAPVRRRDRTHQVDAGGVCSRSENSVPRLGQDRERARRVREDPPDVRCLLGDGDGDRLPVPGPAALEHRGLRVADDHGRVEVLERGSARGRVEPGPVGGIGRDLERLLEERDAPARASQARRPAPPPPAARPGPARRARPPRRRPRRAVAPRGSGPRARPRARPSRGSRGSRAAARWRTLRSRRESVL